MKYPSIMTSSLTLSVSVGSEISHFQVDLCLGLKTSPCKFFSFEKEFDLHENELSGGTHFHVNGFDSQMVYWSRIRVMFSCANCDFKSIRYSH